MDPETKLPFTLDEAKAALKPACNGAETEAYHTLHLARYMATLEMVAHLPKESAVLEVAASPFGMTMLLRQFMFKNLEISTFPEGDISDMPDNYIRLMRLGKFEFRLKNFNIEKNPWPYETESFDLVLICEVMEHLALDPMAALVEANRVLRPGGRLLITTPNAVSMRSLVRLLSFKSPNTFPFYRPASQYLRHNRELTPREVFALMEAAGFSPELLTTMRFTNRERLNDLQEALLAQLAVEDERGDTILCLGDKTGPVRERYPTAEDLYYPWDVQLGRTVADA